MRAPYNPAHPHGPQIADPICTFVFAFLVLLTTRGIIRDIMHTLMERTPQHVDLANVTQAMTLVGKGCGSRMRVGST